MSAKAKEFYFMGQLIKCNPNCGTTALLILSEAAKRIHILI